MGLDPMMETLAPIVLALGIGLTLIAGTIALVAILSQYTKEK